MFKLNWLELSRAKIFDVAVNLRKNSPNYGQSYGVNLSEMYKLMLLVPKGFAHGFLTLTDVAELVYKVDEKYKKEADSGIKWNDPDIDIKWPFKEYNIEKPILSDKDSQLSFLADFNNPFNYRLR